MRRRSALRSWSTFGRCESSSDEIGVHRSIALRGTASRFKAVVPSKPPGVEAVMPAGGYLNVERPDYGSRHSHSLPALSAPGRPTHGPKVVGNLLTNRRYLDDVPRNVCQTGRRAVTRVADGASRGDTSKKLPLGGLLRARKLHRRAPVKSGPRQPRPRRGLAGPAIIPAEDRAVPLREREVDRCGHGGLSCRIAGGRAASPLRVK